MFELRSFAGLLPTSWWRPAAIFPTMPRGRGWWLVFFLLAAGPGSPAIAATENQAQALSRPTWNLFGDFRVRLESDYDSRQASGTRRDDRSRLRVRLRAGVEYTPDDRLTFGFRLRSGSRFSHQSPHVTVADFDGNATGDADLDPDRWYGRIQGEKAWAWIGRNSLPFWKQNELFWDDDVTPAGLAAGFETTSRSGWKLALTTGYFTLPVGMRDFAGNLGIGQLVLTSDRLTIAGGVLAFDADPGDPDAGRLLRGNGLRNYTVWIASFQARLGTGRRQLVLGADSLYNSESYSVSDPDPITALGHDQTEGFVLSAKLGGTKEKGDWSAACVYAEIESLAVETSYAQDDWVRWGSAVETRSSDFSGYELRLAYALAKNFNLVARLFLVEAISTPEDGKRLRLDLNYRF